LGVKHIAYELGCVKNTVGAGRVAPTRAAGYRLLGFDW
jgi:hypothetical protein